MTRSIWVLFHRYVGLTMAFFLIVTGLTGAIISWDHELDEWLNPHLNKVHSQGSAIDSIELAGRVESYFPRSEVTYFELHTEPGHSQYFWVEPKVDPSTGHLYKLGFNQVYVNPVTGDVLGKREWGQVWPITRETVMSFLYKLHFSLHIPEFWGTDHWGLWLLGAIALMWTIDCFIGLYLTFPAKRRKKTDQKGSRKTWYQRWKSSWKIRWNSGKIKLNFDLHQAVSLWTWSLLLVIAFTAFSLNLYREVFFPVMSMVSEVTPTPLDKITPSGHDNPIEPALTYTDIAGLASQASQIRGWNEPLGSLWYAREFGLYRAEFFTADSGHGSGGVGHKALFFDGDNGELQGDFVPWEGTAADLFVQAQFPVHSGRILGLPGRILISVMGLVIAMLSITGVIIWWRKRKARVRALVARSQKTSSPHFAEPVVQLEHAE